MKPKQRVSREQRLSFLSLLWHAILTPAGWWSQFASPEPYSSEPSLTQKEVLLRGQLTSKVLFILILSASFYIPVILELGDPFTSGLYFAVIAFLLLAAPLNRQHKSTLAGFIVMITIEVILVTLLLVLPGGLTVKTLPIFDFLLIPTVLAGSLLPPWTVFPLAFSNISVIVAATFLLPKAADVQQLFSEDLGGILGIPILLQGIISGISFLGIRGSMNAVREANRADTLDRLYREQTVTAMTDPITGLLNHRAIMQQLEEELLSCQANQRICAIIFVDVDHFKHINDTWGHGAGDAALRTIALRLREGIRQQDFVGRYGGEEFVLLLSQTNQQGAFELAERIRCIIAETPCLWQAEEKQPVISIPLTASFGLAVYPHDGLTKKELLTMADNAMYTAKHTGRNRVCLPRRKSSPLLTVERDESLTQQSEDTMLQTLSTVASFRDQATQAHADRMLIRAEATMRALDRPEEEIVLLCLAAQLHDIGKIGIPDAILHKSGSLTNEEWNVMYRHPQIGQQILTQAKGQFGLISHIVVAHHERWDGQGYPYGLKQDEIPLGARILSVIDAYDAMTSSRPYRNALSTADAKQELLRCAGSQFDPHVVTTFLHVLHTQEQAQNEHKTTRYVTAQLSPPS